MYRKQIFAIIPLISTLNLVIISTFTEYDPLYSNPLGVRTQDGQNNKSSRLPSGQWCRNCSSDCFSIKETYDVNINSSEPVQCEVYTCDKCGREVENWKYSE